MHTLIRSCLILAYTVCKKNFTCPAGQNLKKKEIHLHSFNFSCDRHVPICFSKIEGINLICLVQLNVHLKPGQDCKQSIWEWVFPDI